MSDLGVSDLTFLFKKIVEMVKGLSTELDVVTGYSEIVPDTVVFDDFERLHSLSVFLI